jgi:hypothetical protein
MFKIAITGKANSGKNTVGKLLVKGLPAQHSAVIGSGKLRRPKVHFIAFADPLKEIARITFPEVPRKWLYGPSKFRAEVIPGAFKEGAPLTVRQLLCDLGNDYGRRYQPDRWIRVFDHRVKKLKNVDVLVVTDVRFRNEFDHLKKQGFYQVRLLRNSHLKINDISETSQDGINDSEFDYVLHNNGTLKELKAEAAKIVQILKS